MDPMIKNSFFTILIYWNDNRIHLGLTKKLIFFIWFPPLLVESTTKVRKCDLSIKSTQINLQWGYVRRLRVDGHLLVKIITSEERMHHF